MKINCAVCKKEKNIRPVKVKDRNFCSHACYWIDKDKRQSVACSACGNVMLLKQGLVGKQTTCSMACRSLIFSGEDHQRYKKVPDRFCETCSKELTHRSATRDRVKHCSISCAKKGEKQWSWKGGIWPYASEFEKKIRYEIRIRDKNTCQSCGSKKYGKRNLHVHHIDQNKKNNNQENLITLCPLCHRREHSGKALRVKEEKSQSFL